MATPGTRFERKLAVLRRSFCVILVAGFSLAVVGFVAAADSSPSAKWEKAIRTFEAADKTSPPPQGAVLFIGSSSIRFWKSLAKDFPQYNVINRGFGGSQIADSTYYADRIVIPYRPSAIILHAGGNDIAAGKTPRQVYDDFRAFVEKVHAAMPETPIAFVSINPTPARWSQAEKQKETNGLIKRYIESDHRLAYINIWDALLGPDGQPRPDLHIKDRLHPNAAGYKIRAEIINKYLDTLKLPKK
jgi:lysophospholipase L1-like esterase